MTDNSTTDRSDPPLSPLDLGMDKLELPDFAILSTTLGGDLHLQYACVVANNIECTNSRPKVSFTDDS